MRVKGWQLAETDRAVLLGVQGSRPEDGSDMTQTWIPRAVIPQLGRKAIVDGEEYHRVVVTVMDWWLRKNPEVQSLLEDEFEEV